LDLASMDTLVGPTTITATAPVRCSLLTAMPGLATDMRSDTEIFQRRTRSECGALANPSAGIKAAALTRLATGIRQLIAM
jgi:hypothetical protein